MPVKRKKVAVKVRAVRKPKRVLLDPDTSDPDELHKLVHMFGGFIQALLVLLDYPEDQIRGNSANPVDLRDALSRVHALKTRAESIEAAFNKLGGQLEKANGKEKAGA
jgi:hypothetical protein